MKKALIFQGGWEGHEPVLVAERFALFLRSERFEVEVSDTIDCLNDAQRLSEFDLLVPVWTDGEITDAQCEAVSYAAAGGMGIAGCHGGMCASFRNSVLWHFIVGGNWVSHPGDDGVKYTVNIKNTTSPLMDDISDFEVCSEHYYLHVDPAVEVLATTRFPVARGFHSANKAVDMPVVWTKRWGHGRVFYSSLGHHNDIMDLPQAFEIMKRGMLWAAEGRHIATSHGLMASEFESDMKIL